jgi:uncharacterized protein (DUF924 family)
MDISRAKDVLNYWFKEDGSADFDKWFMNSKAYDNEIKEKFGDLLKEAEKGNGFGWLANKDSFIAYIILLDQFSRHIYRDTPNAFKNDKLVMIFTNLGFDLYVDQLVDYEFMFAYMPYMHTECMKYQKKGAKKFNVCKVKLSSEMVWGREGEGVSSLSPEHLECNKKKLNMLENMTSHVNGHFKTLERFGRFPKRNEALSRDSTEEEIKYINNEAKNRPY